MISPFAFKKLWADSAPYSFTMVVMDLETKLSRVQTKERGKTTRASNEYRVYKGVARRGGKHPVMHKCRGGEIRIEKSWVMRLLGGEEG